MNPHDKELLFNDLMTFSKHQLALWIIDRMPFSEQWEYITSLREDIANK